MLNAEKYKDEIKTIIEQVVENKEKGAVNCKINSLTGVSCGNHSGCNDCKLKALIWLLEEYKEPILTEKEIAYKDKNGEDVYKNLTYHRTLKEALTALIRKK